VQVVFQRSRCDSDIRRTSNAQKRKHQDILLASGLLSYHLFSCFHTELLLNFVLVVICIGSVQDGMSDVWHDLGLTVGRIRMTRSVEKIHQGRQTVLLELNTCRYTHKYKTDLLREAVLAQSMGYTSD
jgi:hypothetical protein